MGPDAITELAGVREILFKPRVLILGFSLMMALLFFKPLLMTGLLVAIGAVSIIYKRYISIGIDFELCSLCAVAVGSVYGAAAGAVSGGISILFALFLNGHLMENPFFALIKVITYAMLGAAAGIFATANLVLMAGVFTFIADAIFVLIAMNGGGNAGKLIIFLLTHPLIVIYQLRLLLPMAKAIL